MYAKTFSGGQSMCSWMVLAEHCADLRTAPLHGGEHVLDVRAADAEHMPNVQLNQALDDEVADEHVRANRKPDAMTYLHSRAQGAHSDVLQVHRLRPRAVPGDASALRTRRETFVSHGPPVA
jgi:hypothetical protein